MTHLDSIAPTVSVIITCYNHGNYLADAIDSVKRQTYNSIEIVVIDDGSTDETASVVATFPNVKYVYQENAGLSAARNRGVNESTGKYLMFLDADDWLMHEAVAINLSHLKRNKHCVMVAGGHVKVNAFGEEWERQTTLVEKNHYEELLKGNFIGMHGAVMYLRTVFNEFRFDPLLPACEDYDLYLRVARKYPVCMHGYIIAAYRFHQSNMSADHVRMLSSVLGVLQRQRSVVTDKTEREALDYGRGVWTDYYASRLYDALWNRIPADAAWASWKELLVLFRWRPKKAAAYLVKHSLVSMARLMKGNLPDNFLRALHEVGMYKNYLPPVGKVDVGDLERATPLSSDFGFDRGGAIDRFYIEEFLETNAQAIRGTVLEIGDNEYTLKFGRTCVSKSDILHIDSSNEKATYVADIAHAPQMPSEYFDCIIFTQTLHLIYDFKSALATCYRILKPGGTLLLTVPGITQVDKGEWKDYWLWSFTDTAMKKVMADTFNGSRVEVKTFGNVYVASAFLYGMGLPEVSRSMLCVHDPAYQVIVSVRATKH